MVIVEKSTTGEMNWWSCVENSFTVIGNLVNVKLFLLLFSHITCKNDFQVFVASRLNVPGAWQMPQVIIAFSWFCTTLPSTVLVVFYLFCYLESYVVNNKLPCHIILFCFPLEINLRGEIVFDPYPYFYCGRGELKKVKIQSLLL